MESIKLLIQENQNRLDAINKFLSENTSNGSLSDTAKFSRLNQERICLEEINEQLKSIFPTELPDSTMKIADAEILKNLEYGQKVYRLEGAELRGFRFVGVMPSCKNYLIFEDGEMLVHLHISSKDNSFRGDWYVGEYDSKFLGQLKIQRLLKKIESTREIYFK